MTAATAIAAAVGPSGSSILAVLPAIQTTAQQYSRKYFLDGHMAVG